MWFVRMKLGAPERRTAHQVPASPSSGSFCARFSFLSLRGMSHARGGPGCALLVFLVGRVHTPDFSLPKLVRHNSKLSCMASSGPLDSKWEKERLQEKNAMVDGQERKHELTRQTASRQARGDTKGRSLCEALSLFLSQKSSHQVTIKRG